MDTPLTLEVARTVLDGQPFSRLLGTRLLSFGGGAAELALEIRDDLRQQFGYVHGGVLAYLVDNAVTFAAGGVPLRRGRDRRRRRRDAVRDRPGNGGRERTPLT